MPVPRIGGADEGKVNFQQEEVAQQSPAHPSQGSGQREDHSEKPSFSLSDANSPPPEINHCSISTRREEENPSSEDINAQEHLLSNPEAKSDLDTPISQSESLDTAIAQEVESKAPEDFSANESTPLHDMVFNFDVSSLESDIRQLYKAFPEMMFQRNSEGLTPMTLAVRENRKDIVSLYIKLGAAFEGDPLSMAIEKNNFEMVNVLMGNTTVAFNAKQRASSLSTEQRASSLSTEQRSLSEPQGNIFHDMVHDLDIDIKTSEQDILEWVNIDSSLMYQLNAEGQTPLTLAVIKQRYDMVAIFIKCRVDIFRSTSSWGENALDLAIGRQNAELVETILSGLRKIGVSAQELNKPLKGGETYLMKMLFSEKMVRSFLRYFPSVDLNYCNAEGFNPLMLAIRRSYLSSKDKEAYLKSAERLLEMPNIDINAVSKKQGKEDRGSSLLSRKESHVLAMLNQNESSVLTMAIVYRCSTVMRRLLELGVNVNAEIESCLCTCTALCAAASIGNIEAARLLISKGALVDLGSRDNSTPLMFAVYFSQVEMVELLIQNKADISIENTIQDKDALQTSEFLHKKYLKEDSIKKEKQEAIQALLFEAIDSS